MTLPQSPGRWFARGVRSEFEAGEVRVVTGPAFAGAALVIRTPEAESRVRGTTLAVIRLADSTCVCAFDETIEVRGRDGQTRDLQAGKRIFLYADGRPPVTVDLDAMETMKLGMVRDRYRPVLSAPVR
jgi:ferric-dicitrate binding protein FerR (iron transport regulator)